MRATLWGTRGSIAAAGPETVRYGGDTSCVEVLCDNGTRLILDAGSGIRSLGVDLAGSDRVDIVLSHLHMDHVQGLPFFVPLLDPESEVHIWGPRSISQGLRERLARYLSPPLFPIHVRDLENVWFHDIVPGEFEIGGTTVTADLISHPGATLGFRLTRGGATIAYLPDHEPALGNPEFPDEPEWTSGFDLAAGVDVLIHDAQYTDAEYVSRAGWGHTSVGHLARFAEMTGPGRLVTFHHDPGHGDVALDGLHEDLAGAIGGIELVPGRPGLDIEL